MSAEQFWKDDPQLFVSYRTFFINKKKREMEETDYKCWLNGLYIHNGNGVLMQAFAGNKNNTKVETYPKKPYSELEKEKTNNTKNNDNYQNYQNSLMVYGSIKEIYTKKLLNKSKKGE